MKFNIQKYSLAFLLFFVSFILFAQTKKEINIPVNQRVILNFVDHIVYAEVLTSDNNKVKPTDDLYYFWFNSNDIKRTRGGFDGKLLHGTYTAFYLNKNLLEKGEFRYGLKNGKWKSWYINGEFKEITHWKKGKRKGRTQLFDEKGKLGQEENYKDDVLHGKVITYSEGKRVVRKYNDGTLKVKKERNRYLFFFKKKEKKSKDEKKSEDKKADKDKKTEEIKEDKIEGNKEKENKKITEDKKTEGNKTKSTNKKKPENKKTE